MVQAPNFTDVVREHVIRSKAAEDYHSLTTSEVEKLYSHGVYLSSRLESLLKIAVIPDHTHNSRMLNRARHAIYNELCDFGLKDVADSIMETYKNLPK